MKKYNILLVSVLICLFPGCSPDSGTFNLFSQSDSSESNHQITIKWPNGDEEKLDRPYFDEYSKNKFLENCGRYYKTSLDDNGLIRIKCPQISEGIKHILDPEHYIDEVREEEVRQASFENMIKELERMMEESEAEGIVYPPPQLPVQVPNSANSEPRFVDKTPKLKIGNPEVKGAINKRIIQKIVRNHVPELTACFEAELVKKKDLSGKIKIKWVISPEGDVATALVKESTMKNKKVETCMINSIKKLRFPKPKDGLVHVDYPFVFE